MVSAQQVIERFEDTANGLSDPLGGLGDLETMLAGIWWRRENLHGVLESSGPAPGYRGTKLRRYLRERGARRTTKWGATALRGLFRTEKQFIQRFYELLKRLEAEHLTEALEGCADAYVLYSNTHSPAQPALSRSEPQRVLQEALTRKSQGKIQQGLTFSALRLRIRYGLPATVESKPTHAADAPSGEPGDIFVRRRTSQSPLMVIEVKAGTVSEDDCLHVLNAHGNHDYLLLLCAGRFKTISARELFNEFERSIAILTEDFVLSEFASTVIQSGKDADDLIWELLDIYNVEFCDHIENDESIKIRLSS